MLLTAFVPEARAQDPGEPDEVFCWLTVPRQVTVGKPFTITVRIENARANQPFTLRCIAIDEQYMAGFDYQASQPAAVRFWQDTDRYIEMDYNHVIAAGSTVDYILTMVATKPGKFIGYLDFEEATPGLQAEDVGPFGSRAVQTIVVGQ